MAAKPMLPNGFLGPQPKFKEFQLVCISHSTPEVTVEGNKCVIIIKMKKPMKISSNLICCINDKPFRDLILSQILGEICFLWIVLPAAGYFKLQIYALPASEESKALPGVYNYLLHVATEPPKPVYPFPKQYAQWKENCFLECPHNLLGLSDLTHVKFRARIPGAKSVALVLAGKWSKLEQKEDDFWEATIDVSSAHGTDNPACLNANFGDDPTKFAAMLEYPMSDAAAGL